jgi:hypothetical protein
MFNNTFKPLTENKPIWFTEVGAMFCKTSGYLGPAFQNASAANLVNHADGKVTRTYYYALAKPNNEEGSCPEFDSRLLGGGGVPRPAYKTVFPGAAYPPPSTQKPDFSGDGKADIIGRRPDGTLWMYRGNGAGAFASEAILIGGGGWTSYDILFSPGDFSGDGKADIVGRRPDGTLWMYRGDGAGQFLGEGAGTQLPNCCWSVFDTMFSPGDFNGDGKSDIIGRKPDGTLWMYRGDGAGQFLGEGAGTLIGGAGWQVYDRLFGP